MSKLTKIVGVKAERLCILKVDNELGLVVLLPNGKLVPGQVETSIKGSGRDSLVRINMRIYICGFNKGGEMDAELCSITYSCSNKGAVNGSDVRISLPSYDEGSFLPGEKELNITANDGEVMYADIGMNVGDVVDNEGNSIMVRGTASWFWMLNND